MSKEPKLNLRDWFAGLAMQTYCALNEGSPTDETIAKWSYELADAMLAEKTSRLTKKTDGVSDE